MGEETEITTVQAAKRLQVSLGWIYTLIRSGELAAVRRSGRWVIPIAAIDERKRRTEARYAEGITIPARER